MFTDTERIVVIERLIQDFRWARNDDKVPEHQTYVVLKEIALELRSRSPNVVGAAQTVLADRIDRALASRTPIGLDRGLLTALAQEVIRFRSTILQALKKFEGQTS